MRTKRDTAYTDLCTEEAHIVLLLLKERTHVGSNLHGSTIMLDVHILAQNSQTVTDMDAFTLPCLRRMEECVALDSEGFSRDRP